ncbi:MAG: hypothetical protein WKF73_19265 [Nocardioidaceae bacterium]
MIEVLRADYVRTARAKGAAQEPRRRGACPAELTDPRRYLHRHRRRQL